MIITNNENALRIKCEDVLPEEVEYLTNLLEKELDHANYLGKSGVGLAAPQIGIYKKIAIVRLAKNHNSNLNLINCNIDQGFDPIIFKNEGCLSLPNRQEDTTRFQEVYITNNLVYPYSFIATGLLAIICQHEIDHLNGILFIDHMLPKIVPIINNKKIGSNDICFCGSNKKFKRCCKGVK